LGSLIAGRMRQIYSVRIIVVVFVIIAAAVVVALQAYVGPWPLFQFLDSIHSQ
jgi:hypothetical protein